LEKAENEDTGLTSFDTVFDNGEKLSQSYIFAVFLAADTL